MTTRRIHPTRRARRQAGFSIIEVLIGFLILLLVLMGLLPLFTRAIVHNVSGREATVVTNFGTTQVENLLSVSFNSWETQLPLSGNVLQRVDYWGRPEDQEPGAESWTDDPDGLLATWRRTTEIRQFGISSARDTNLDGVPDTLVGLEDGDHDGYFDNELSGGTTPNAINLKEVRVLVESQRTPFGASEPTELTLRTLKAF